MPEELAKEEILRRILEVAPGLHTAKTLSPGALERIAWHAGRLEVRHSAETGSGASTLLLSHWSRQHTVFALDEGSGSIVNVRRSPLLRPGTVTFVEGPTQQTLPQHRFTESLQLALLDGPHGYPFPDLEYFYFYPHLDAGAVLIVDDIHIRSVHNLFEFLCRDAMFRLVEVVDKTAFFRRTEAPVFPPFGDGWWDQNYNRRPLRRYLWRETIKSCLPQPLRLAISRRLRRSRTKPGGCAIEIGAPVDRAPVGSSGSVEGTAVLPPDSHLWILVHRSDWDGWWPQGDGPVTLEQGRWSVMVNYGGPQDAGFWFEIAAIAVGPATHELWLDWVKTAAAREYPPVALPPPEFVLGEAYRTVKRT
jgi:hypothetical protein